MEVRPAPLRMSLHGWMERRRDGQGFFQGRLMMRWADWQQDHKNPEGTEEVVMLVWLPCT